MTQEQFKCNCMICKRKFYTSYTFNFVCMSCAVDEDIQVIRKQGLQPWMDDNARRKTDGNIKTHTELSGS
jgi:hypothetical protein